MWSTVAHSPRLIAAGVLMLLAIAAEAGTAVAVAKPLSAMTIDHHYAFTSVGFKPGREGTRREVLSFKVEGLKQYALLLWPAGDRPSGGWPVVQFNHGFHPDPPRNGFNASGESDRPGDYYRKVVQAFARAGFAVVVPDYRGHNISEGGAFTSRPLADVWYSRDAVGCFLALESLDDIDLEQAYMLGHSMGGAVTLRAMKVLGARVNAGAVWSTSGRGVLAATLDRELTNSTGEDYAGFGKPVLDAVKQDVEALEQIGDSGNLDPVANGAEIHAPLSIHHSAGDASTPVAASKELAARLYLADRDYQLKIFTGSHHLFAGEQFEQAVARDIAWFRRHR